MMVLMVLIGAIGVPQSHDPRPLNSRAIGALLIVSSFVYNCASGPLTNTLCAEIPSALLRSKSVVLARWAYIVSTIIANTLTTYQLNTTAWNWGAKTGFFWAGGCFLSVIFSYFLVPETQDRTTAEMDILFERRVPPRHFAKTKADLVQLMDQKVEDK
jgi:MFS transporter, SP family, general alpha glucoside:H+ symporter